MKEKKCDYRLFCSALLLLMVQAAAASESYVSRTVKVNDWYIGPQPALADLEDMRSAGAAMVINTRLPSEMAKLDFDEAPEVYALGMQYHVIPIGGDDYPFAPPMLESFSQAVEASKGPILMHCRSGYRVSVLAAAYLVKNHQMTMEDAIDTVGNARVKPETVQLLLHD